MAKLHQILAVEAGARAQAQKDLTAAHHGLQKPDMLTGLAKVYTPIKDDGDRFPSERLLLQTRAAQVVTETQRIHQKVFDVIASRDFTNAYAKGDVVVEGVTLVKDAPTPYLLWLEKQITDLHTFVCKLPVLPGDIEWVWDANQDCYKNKEEIKTVKTAKTPYALVLYNATKEHPAQVAEKAKDDIVGHWVTQRYCGALPRTQIVEMKERAEKLLKAVKFAREKANEAEVTDQSPGAGILGYIFGGTK